MASPFAKYQSEQVQQLAPGFVEGFGRAGASIGQGIANLGQGIATGIEERDKVKKEEAKQQAFLGAYLKRDPRVQGINQHLASGDLQKDENGNVFVPDDRRELFDPVKLDDALSFYNKTGGDGSKLTGDELTKFATAFEADKKYEADEAAKAAAALERRKVEAEINKMNADAAEKYARAGIGAVIGAFGSGQDVSQVPFSPRLPMPMAGATSAPQPTPTAGFSVLTGAPSTATTPAAPARPGTVTPQSVTAGRPTTQALSTASTTPAVATTNAPAVAPVKAVTPASVPAVATAPMPTNTTTAETSKAYLTEIPRLQQARVELDKNFQREVANFSAQHQIALARITAQGATPEEIKALGETANTRYKLMTDRYSANIATLDSRLQGFQKAADEARAAEKAVQGVAAEKREQLKTNVEYGAEGKPAAKGSFKTFWQKSETEIENAGIIPGRTGGTKAIEMKAAAKAAHDAKMKNYPAWYQVGLTTEGANQYRFRMVEPTAEPINEGNRGNIQTVVEGYAEGRTFLTNLLAAVESTDDQRIRNYLDRFIVTTSKDDVYAEGEQLGQFGVATFRRAIVSGGNFSDADREYVKALITQINSPNAFKDKDYQLAQTRVLAKFIDSKFRTTLAANGVRLDLDTSEKFLKREDVNGSNADALDSLEKAKTFYRAYGIDTNKTEKPSKPNAILDIANLDGQIKAADEAGNMRLKRALEQMKKEHIESKKRAAEKAAAEAARARGA